MTVDEEEVAEGVLDKWDEGAEGMELLVLALLLVVVVVVEAVVVIFEDDIDDVFLVDSG